MNGKVLRYYLRRNKRLDSRGEKPIIKVTRNFDDEPENQNQNHNQNQSKKKAKGAFGNTRLPFGLCQKFGISIDPSWTPRDAWEALAGKGIYHDDVFNSLKKNGSTEGVKPKSSGNEETVKKFNASVDSIRKYGYNSTYIKEALADMPKGGILRGTITYSSGEKKDIYFYKYGDNSYAMGDKNGPSMTGTGKKSIAQVASYIKKYFWTSKEELFSGEFDEARCEEVTVEFEKRIKDNSKIKKADKKESTSYLSNFDNSRRTNVSNRCETAKCEYKVPKKLNKALSNDEIIKKVSGGDETGGSCVSAALAYIGNKHGYDVMDFRGGRSRENFSYRQTTQELSDKFKGNFASGSELDASQKVISQMEVGKEYYFVAGRHCAIVRKNESGEAEYLELQSPAKTGWNKLDSSTLRKRFKVTSGFYGSGAYSIDIDNFKGSGQFEHLLGYINTREMEQKKGLEGEEK